MMPTHAASPLFKQNRVAQPNIPLLAASIRLAACRPIRKHRYDFHTPSSCMSKGESIHFCFQRCKIYL